MYQVNIVQRQQKPLSRMKKLGILVVLIGLTVLWIDDCWFYWQHRQMQNIVNTVALQTAYEYCTGGDNPIQYGYNRAAEFGVIDSASDVNLAIAINQTNLAVDTVVVMQYPIEGLVPGWVYPSDSVSAIVSCSFPEGESARIMPEF